ncbi:MAG: MBL fold metallo-hydrolase [Chloroflexi bacterium]|nr:MBL fold metallo-hydrolase [Chloroflexota bacterium]
MRRRELIKLGAVATSIVAVGGMGQMVAMAKRAPPQLAIPTVDRLILTSAVDNVYDAILAGQRFGNVDIQRLPLRTTSPAAEHGLALHLESYRGDERRQVLVDFGLTSRSLLTNYGLLGIDPSQADGLILSHGHFDDFGDLLDLASQTPAWADRGATLYAGGEDTFCMRWNVLPDRSRVNGNQLDQGELEARGMNVELAKQPTIVADHTLVSGQIPRVTDFEQIPPMFRIEVGASGTECGDTSHYLPTAVEAQPGDLVPDVFQGEIATVYNVHDRGLVVIASCGHSGIINTIRYVQQVTGIDKIHAVVGGWHLAAAPETVVRKTVDNLQQIGRLLRADALHGFLHGNRDRAGYAQTSG